MAWLGQSLLRYQPVCLWYHYTIRSVRQLDPYQPDLLTPWPLLITTRHQTQGWSHSHSSWEVCIGGARSEAAFALTHEQSLSPIKRYYHSGIQIWNNSSLRERNFLPGLCMFLRLRERLQNRLVSRLESILIRPCTYAPFLWPENEPILNQGEQTSLHCLSTSFEHHSWSLYIEGTSHQNGWNATAKKVNSSCLRFPVRGYF